MLALAAAEIVAGGAVTAKEPTPELPPGPFQLYDVPLMAAMVAVTGAPLHTLYTLPKPATAPLMSSALSLGAALPLGVVAMTDTEAVELKPQAGRATVRRYAPLMASVALGREGVRSVLLKLPGPLQT